MRPDFLGIGAQKAGTTWLYRTFGQHPGIWMPPEKELHAFDEKLVEPHPLREKLFGSKPRDERWRRQVRRHLRRYRAERTLSGLAWDARYFLGRPSHRWYARLFAAGGDRVTGEITPDYSVLDRDQVETVHRINPDIKVVFIVRNPVERAWSHAAMEIGRAKGHDLASVPKRLIRHFEAPRSRRFGDYLATIDTWSDVFGPDQIFLAFLEDVSRHPAALLDRICDHVGASRLDRYPGSRQKVHSGALDTMRLDMAQHLARLYLDLVTQMDARYGGYAGWWAYCLRKLLDDPPDTATVDYPFFDGPIWDEWMKSAGEPAWLAEPQSNALPRVRQL